MLKGEEDEDITCMDTTTSSWSDTKKTHFKYDKLVLMSFCQLSWEPIAS
jgi:hypothetical protein